MARLVDDMLWFGKYKGERLCAVPIGYLQWTLKTLGDLETWEKLEIRKELRRRGASTGEEERAHTPSSWAVLPSGVTPATLLLVISAGRQTLAKRLHPDAGGSNEEMQRANMAADFLEKQARALPGGTGN